MGRKQYIVFLLLTCFTFFPDAAEVYRERVYVQTDKQSYLAGELVWLKMYIINQEGLPSSLSKVGYVELLDEESALIQAKIEIKEGEGTGWLELPVTLPTAHYRLVAYTHYMCNEGEDAFFNKQISVMNTFRTDKTIEIEPPRGGEKKFRPEPLDNIHLSTGSTLYRTRSKVEVELNYLPGDLQSLCVSVAGVDFLTGIPVTTMQTWQKEQLFLPDVAFSGHYMAEYEGHIIRGRVVDLQVPDAPVTDKVVPLLSFPGNDVRVFSGQVGENGDVTFYTFYNQGRREVATTAISYTGKQYRIDLQPPFVSHASKQLSPLVLKPEWEEALLQRSMALQVLHTFMKDSLSHIKPGPSYFYNQPDWSYDFDKYTRFATMEEVVVEFLLPLRFRRMNNRRVLGVMIEGATGFSGGNSLVLLDGIPLMDHELLFNYDPYLIKQVDVYRGQYVFGDQLFNGIAAFRTYRNNYPGLVLDAASQVFDYEGTQGVRYFYIPDYDSPEVLNSRLPDYRHTLLWNPDLKTNGAKKVDFSFYTSDLTGKFIIKAEGITKEGKTVFATQTIEVNDHE